MDKSLGQVLVEANIITAQQWQQVLDEQQITGNKVEDILVKLELVTRQQLAFFISMQLNVPYVALARQQIDPMALALVPERIAREYNIIPLYVNDGALVVAMNDPQDLHTIEDLEAVTRKRIEPVLSILEDIQEAIDNHYRASGEIEEQLSHIPLSFQRGEALESGVSAQAIAQAPVVLALDLLVSQAVRDRASDVHLEPQEDRLRVRYRIDWHFTGYDGPPSKCPCPPDLPGENHGRYEHC